MTSSGPRIHHLMPPYTPQVDKALDFRRPSDSNIEPLKLFRTIARNLPLGAAMGAIGGFLLEKTNIDFRFREIVIDRVTARCGCEYEWGVHIRRYAAHASLSEDQIYSIVHGSSKDPCWDAKDRALIDMVDELNSRATLSDDAFNALNEHFEEEVIIELLVLTGWYHTISFLANGAQTELEDWAPGFPDRN